MPAKPQPELWPETGLHATWIGHSTVLLKIDGVIIVTDPVFSNRIGLNFGRVTVGPKRLMHPALNAAEIPRPDIVLLSHAHMDHFDIPSLRKLQSKHTEVVTASKTADLLDSSRFSRVTELGWSESVQCGPVKIQAFGVRHWGARMQSDTYRGYNGYVIETARHKVIFGGDTALTDSFRSLRNSRPAHLAIMPIGAYNPWIRAHCTPEQALQMANDAGADRLLPVHHQTFRLGSEPALEPIERLAAALSGEPDRLVLTSAGQEFHA